ncbi:hypothetical protein N0K08_21520 [Acidovorax sp. Be4]|uniref:Uncharacterized protein n=1 Tax=Acidovorax bellezanensis TaxID=2976702 RepID=A0ABT2PVN7_9BURK|nr:hypothetical protein [Acidovorax sp. Be4]MCT9813218.1 hypothetical protein [Acidovorax sp. Be4]
MTNEFDPLPQLPLTSAQREKLEFEQSILLKLTYREEVPQAVKEARYAAISELLLDDAWMNFPGPDPDSSR